MTREELAERLEGAEEGSRELSDEVLLALGWTCDEEMGTGYFPGTLIWAPPNNPAAAFIAGQQPQHPCPTTDMNAALALVPHDWDCGQVDIYPTRGLFDAVMSKGDLWDGGKTAHAKAATPALALCASILRAMEAGRAD